MRILIVDDDAGLRQSLGLLLKESGYDVTAEADPEQALVRAGTEPFDLILCDVRMPRVDGLAFLRRYRADGGDALLIMMSAFGSEDAALAAMREGAYDYLHKPFRPDEVILTVRKAEERERHEEHDQHPEQPQPPRLEHRPQHRSRLSDLRVCVGPRASGASRPCGTLVPRECPPQHVARPASSRRRSSPSSSPGAAAATR